MTKERETCHIINGFKQVDGRTEPKTNKPKLIELQGLGRIAKL